MRKATNVILALSIIVNIILGFIILKPKKQIQEYPKKIDTLESEISKIKIKRDTIRERIDTTIIKIKENEKYYKETVSVINSNNINDDYIFFINYLEWNRERLNNNIDTLSIKRN